MKTLKNVKRVESSTQFLYAIVINIDFIAILKKGLKKYKSKVLNLKVSEGKIVFVQRKKKQFISACKNKLHEAIP